MSEKKEKKLPTAESTYRRKRICSTEGCWRLAQPYNDKCLKCLAEVRSA